MSEFTCSHCGDEFQNDEEDAYLHHLTDMHKEDLSRIDKERIRSSDTVSIDDTPTRKEFVLQTVILTFGFLLSAGIVYLLFL